MFDNGCGNGNEISEIDVHKGNTIYRACLRQPVRDANLDTNGFGVNALLDHGKAQRHIDACPGRRRDR